MVLRRLCDLRHEEAPLSYETVPDPEPAAGELLIEVSVCGVCHTELDEIEGRTPPRTLPMILGHQAVGRVVARGAGAERIAPGTRVGVAWIGSACGVCARCQAGEENLCAAFVATGRDVPGGYAERATVREDFAHPIPEGLSDVAAAPLLCAGAIGWRSLRLTELADGERLGLTGFGASAHLVLAMARRRFPRSEVYVFARNPEERVFARELGAVWAGESDATAPVKLDAIIDTTPAWKPVVAALANLEPGGRLVINAIRKESADRAELTSLDYARHLWLEKEIKSVANVTRADVRDFLAFAGEAGIVPETSEFPLADANPVLVGLKRGAARGAKVLRVT
jgi:propanol-preferring alcohol dehydrogenase